MLRQYSRDDLLAEVHASQPEGVSVGELALLFDGDRGRESLHLLTLTHFTTYRIGP